MVRIVLLLFFVFAIKKVLRWEAELKRQIERSYNTYVFIPVFITIRFYVWNKTNKRSFLSIGDDFTYIVDLHCFILIVNWSSYWIRFDFLSSTATDTYTHLINPFVFIHFNYYFFSCLKHTKTRDLFYLSFKKFLFSSRPMHLEVLKTWKHFAHPELPRNNEGHHKQCESFGKLGQVLVWCFPESADTIETTISWKLRFPFQFQNLIKQNVRG